MTKIEKAAYTLRRMSTRGQSAVSLDSSVAAAVSILYLCMMLSVGVGRLSMLLWFALYPILASAWLGIPFGRIFRNSLVIVPLAAIIGMFNPMFDRKPAFNVGEAAVSEGWISFLSIIIRGLLAMQCVLILIECEGFTGLCRGMRRLGVPRFLTDQLQFVYRYLSVLLQEAISMKRARESRGYGRRSYPLKAWGAMTGQLFLRAVDRSERIHRAMLARGFDGNLPDYSSGDSRIRSVDIIYLLVWTAAFCAMRLTDLSAMLFKHWS